MKARWSGVASAVAAMLALLLACTRSVSTPPPHPLASQTAPAVLQLSPSPTTSPVNQAAYPSPGVSAVPTQPPILVTQVDSSETPIVQIPLAGPLSQPEGRNLRHGLARWRPDPAAPVPGALRRRSDRGSICHPAGGHPGIPGPVRSRAARATPGDVYRHGYPGKTAGIPGFRSARHRWRPCFPDG